MNLCVQLCLKLMVSNVGPSHFLFNSVFRGGLLSSLFMWACCSRVLKPYRHHHTPPLPLLCPTTPSPLLDYPHSPFPMSALRAIIIMPCINNASQYSGYGAGGRGSTDGLFVVRRIITFTTCLKLNPSLCFQHP